MTETGRYIGIMSGTSLDGIDVALIEVNNSRRVPINIIGFESIELPDTLKQSIIKISHDPVTMREVQSVSVACAELYADATNLLLKNYDVDPITIKAIGCHGITVWHQPDESPRCSTQIIEPNYLAYLTGIDVVTDFRTMDMAAGGQGAPLVPAFHRIMTKSLDDCIWLNIGGIANISVLTDSNIFGYDTGPGNTLINHYCQSYFGRDYDDKGNVARQGQVHQSLLNELLQDAYFSKSAPKSTGKERFNKAWVEKACRDLSLQLSGEDLLCSLTHLSAITISAEINKYNVKQVIVSGGGSYNNFLMSILESYLPNKLIRTSETLGIESQQVEAAAFAWLAYCRINGVSANTPSVTGAESQVVLGGWYKGSGITNE